MVLVQEIMNSFGFCHDYCCWDAYFFTMKIFVVSEGKKPHTHAIKLLYFKINFLHSYMRKIMENVNNKILSYILKKIKTRYF